MKRNGTFSLLHIKLRHANLDTIAVEVCHNNTAQDLPPILKGVLCVSVRQSLRITYVASQYTPRQLCVYFVHINAFLYIVLVGAVC